MTITFRPAIRENVNLLIGLAGASGTGKTYSAMLLAKGMSGGKRFAVIDTENGRASHYADRFDFDVAELRPPYSPNSYLEAIKAADAAGYGVIVVDSMSHEYAGDGGVLDMQESEFRRMGERESVKVASWIKPKMAHKEMMQGLLQTKAHLILCFRAEAKIDVVRGEDGKTKIVPKQSPIGLDGWIPVTEKSVPFELTVSFLLTPDQPGVPHVIKLQEQHKPFFPLDAPICEESGRLIAAWAAGGKPKAVVAQQAERLIVDQQVEGSSPSDSAFITIDQALVLEDACNATGVPVASLKKKAGVTNLWQIRSEDFDRAQAFIAAKAAAMLARAKG